MRLQTSLLLVIPSTLLCLSINAQALSGDVEPAAATTTQYQPVTHTVAVGRGGHTFSPDVVQAEVGSIIEFDFYPVNHSVVRAACGYPCVPYELTGPNVGFFSGFKPVDAILSDPPKWSVRVNDTDPIFYYCSAVGSCMDFAMVGVINPNASVSLAVQKELALNSTFMLQPGQPWPAEASTTVVPPTASAPSQTSTPTSTTLSTSTPVPASSTHKTSLSAGGIAGIAIGGAAVVLVATVLIWFCGRQSRRTPGPDAPPPTYVPPAYVYSGGGPPMSPLNSPSGKHVSASTTTATATPLYSAYQPPAFDQQQQQAHMAPFGPMQPPLQRFYTTTNGVESSAYNNPLDVEPQSQPSPPPPPLVTGLEAYLQRQGRLSPQLGPGPFEMAAGVNGLRRGV